MSPAALAPVETTTLAASILAITAEVPAIKATGKSPFSKEPALSIGDVEDALRKLLVKHGVLIHFQTRHLIPPTEGHREWVAEVTANVGNGKENFLADWADSGGTPAAAYSFARKSYLKQLFHIADGEDAPPAAGATQTRVLASAPPAAPANGGKVTVISREPVTTADDRVRFCPDCGTGALELVTWSNGHAAITCTNWREKDGACKHREPIEATQPQPDQTPIPW